MRAFPFVTHTVLVLTLVGGGCARAQDTAAALPDAAERRASAVPVREIARSGVDTLFHQVTGLDVDSRGRVYVGDWFAARVAVLDSVARLVGTVGTRGLGPGEFRSIRGLQVLPGDSVLVYDPNAARLSVFAPGQTRPAYVVNVGAAAGGVPFHVKRTRANDEFLAMFRPAFRSDDTARAMDRLQVLERDGRPLAGPIRTYPARAFLRVGNRDSFAVTPDPFGREGLYALGADDRVHYLWSAPSPSRRWTCADGGPAGSRCGTALHGWNEPTWMRSSRGCSRPWCACSGPRWRIRCRIGGRPRGPSWPPRMGSCGSACTLRPVSRANGRSSRVAEGIWAPCSFRAGRNCTRCGGAPVRRGEGRG